MRFPSAAKTRLSWMLGTASVLFASQAWAQGAENALGALFGLAMVFVALGVVAFVVGLVTLFLNLTGHHRTATIVLGILLGLGQVRFGLWLIAPFSEAGLLDRLQQASSVGLLLLGAGEVAAAVRALRANRDRSAAPQSPQA